MTSDSGDITWREYEKILWNAIDQSNFLKILLYKHFSPKNTITVNLPLIAHCYNHYFFLKKRSNCPQSKIYPPILLIHSNIKKWNEKISPPLYNPKPNLGGSPGQRQRRGGTPRRWRRYAWYSGPRRRRAGTRRFRCGSHKERRGVRRWWRGVLGGGAGSTGGVAAVTGVGAGSKGSGAGSTGGGTAVTGGDEEAAGAGDEVAGYGDFLLPRLLL